ncbi:hypothetical protein [Streptomyces sp. CC210A]|uniref:hypothetical protein n=1 Tax=Streptomyces sp. CC210A TaxID=2898184 RepID=UPI001F2863E7|nr:hypothetical protein [Streptomyces sp. CC210A]
MGGGLGGAAGGPGRQGRRPGKRLTADPRLRAELELCERYGIPHSQFLGGDGRWSDLDRAKALAWQRWQRTLCPDCRTRAEEWDPAKGGHQHAYVTDTVRCPGCELIAQERDQVPEGRAGYGIKITLLPRLAYEALHSDGAEAG